MYARDAWRETRPEVLKAAIRARRFATLVVAGPRPEPVHLPVALVEDEAGLRLEGHVARANPIWRALPAEALAMVLCADAYVRPGWYPSKAETGKAVPTWLYVAIHLRGALTPRTAPAWLRAHVARLSEEGEAGRPEPWSASDAPEDYMAAMLRGIVGVSLAVREIEGVWKMNQHHAAENRNGVAAGLAKAPDPGAAAAAAVMHALEDTRDR